MALRGAALLRRSRYLMEQSLAIFGLWSRFDQVPDVFATFGWERRLTVIHHPGVMAISKLLDQRTIVRPRATFNQELVEEIGDYDEDLQRKAQVALDHGLAIEWRVLDFIDDELPRLLAEKKEIEKAREQVMSKAPGDYTQPVFDSTVVVPTPANLGRNYPTLNVPDGDPTETAPLNVAQRRGGSSGGLFSRLGNYLTGGASSHHLAAEATASRPAKMLTRSGTGSLAFPSDSEMGSKLPSAGSNPVRISKLRRLMDSDQVDLDELKKLLWSGCPFDSDFDVRVKAWKLALGYLPPRKDRQKSTIERKRREYKTLTKEFADMFSLSTDDMQPASATAAQQQQYASLRQIRVDIPRTFSELDIFSSERIQKMMERILYIWAVRNPASGYVQGINDLLTPFVVILLQAKVGMPIKDIEVDDEKILSDADLAEVESDAYWMLSRVLSDIQDHYTFGQPGIQRLILRLKDIVKRVDEKLAHHLEDEMIDYLQIAFRWFNCLMLRELPLQCTLRLWDTCIAENDGFSTYMVYICAAFLVHWGPQLEQMDFSEIMLFFQKAPTSRWTEADIETLLAEAFVLKSLFDNAPSHLQNQDSTINPV
ncbi:hypothetical protein FOL47_003280 [Perkinsus chesapeaki]|uniref:Rab-GAP TBC domain-containing protein n=1 Tax=Perkinsus chesapeaki TaxID=330153 RepID=A0A7J6N2S8_PERCH|nr:hypothetical protein FOL47_003280 [Perkinsus chesapeaki]